MSFWMSISYTLQLLMTSSSAFKLLRLSLFFFFYTNTVTYRRIRQWNGMEGWRKCVVPKPRMPVSQKGFWCLSPMSLAWWLITRIYSKHKKLGMVQRLIAVRHFSLGCKATILPLQKVSLSMADEGYLSLQCNTTSDHGNGGSWGSLIHP